MKKNYSKILMWIKYNFQVYIFDCNFKRCIIVNILEKIKNNPKKSKKNIFKCECKWGYVNKIKNITQNVNSQFP
jgi:hypothetical protein